MVDAEEPRRRFSGDDGGSSVALFSLRGDEGIATGELDIMCAGGGCNCLDPRNATGLMSSVGDRRLCSCRAWDASSPRASILWF